MKIEIFLFLNLKGSWVDTIGLKKIKPEANNFGLKPQKSFPSKGRLLIWTSKAQNCGHICLLLSTLLVYWRTSFLVFMSSLIAFEMLIKSIRIALIAMPNARESYTSKLAFKLRCCFTRTTLQQNLLME